MLADYVSLSLSRAFGSLDYSSDPSIMVPYLWKNGRAKAVNSYVPMPLAN